MSRAAGASEHRAVQPKMFTLASHAACQFKGRIPYSLLTSLRNRRTTTLQSNLIWCALHYRS
jgi:hypothetical protein